MSDYCHVAAQIAENADEPEGKECELCLGGVTDSKCDNQCNLGELEDE